MLLFFSVLITTPLTPAAVAYYFRGQAAGRWIGRGTAGLGLAGPVARRDLAALLRGCDPGDGHFLPACKPARRRAGWDLTLAAPKSVSVLAALAGNDGAALAGAHAAAVAEVVEHFELRLLAVRRGPRRPAGLVPPEGLVAAAFHHRVNAAADPHLHTHLIVCNLGRSPTARGRRSTPAGGPQRASVGAIYQMGLRHHLGAVGLSLQWRLREDGFAEVIGVPRAALRATSSRGARPRPMGQPFGAQVAGRTVGIRSTATGAEPGLAGWRPGPTVGGDVGFGPEEAARLLSETRAAAGATRETSDLEQAVTARLASQRSTFRTADVLVALAACTPAGFRGCSCRCAGPSAIATPPIRCPVPPAGRGAGRRRWHWTADERLWACARRVVARPPRRRRATTEVGTPTRTSPGRPSEAARDLVAGDSRSLHVLQAPAGRTNLLAQAAVLEAAGAAWSAAGQRVVVAASSDQAATRWRVLTGLSRQRPGQAAEVVVVDHADRRPTPEPAGPAHGRRSRRGSVPCFWKAAPCRGSAGGAARRWQPSGDGWGRLDPGPAPAWADTLRAGYPPPDTAGEVAGGATASRRSATC